MTISLRGAAYLASVSALLVAATLAASGVAHAVAGGLNGALARQRLVHRVLRRPIAVAVPLIELGLATALVAGFVVRRSEPSLLRAAGLCATVLFVTYFVYQGVLLRTRPGTPCGCSGRSDTPVSPWTLLRAGLLAVASVAVVSMQVPGAMSGPDAFAVCVSAGALAVITWYLPAAITGSSRQAWMTADVEGGEAR